MQWFTEDEAWNIFKIAAWVEAVGWTLLGTGVAFDHFHWPWYASALLLAGRIHGVFFMAYLAALIATFRSLRWPWPYLIIGGLLSIPPYGTLVFELVMAQRRTRRKQGGNRALWVRALVAVDEEVLLVQPTDTTVWQLPGGPVKANELPDQALRRILYELTGKKITPGRLIACYQAPAQPLQRLEFIFHIPVAALGAIPSLKTSTPWSHAFDETKLAVPATVSDFQPDIFTNTSVTAVIDPARTATLFVAPSSCQ